MPLTEVEVSIYSGSCKWSEGIVAAMIADNSRAEKLITTKRNLE
jgi:hypothetical protein